ncbi:lysine-ketoglutarate reductase/saccharopine dehydrogenase bifunctional enzyme isoform X4 [Wolffia australiana]
MYPSLAAAKAAVMSVGEEISTMGLPIEICPIVFVFTGTGNVSLGAQEIFKLLPHTFVDPSMLPELADKQVRDQAGRGHQSKRVFQVYGCVVSCQHIVAPKDPEKNFDKDEYYAYPERYDPVFHEKIAPHASVIVNCMYWEKRFPRLLSSKQLRDLTSKGCPLVGIGDITCDIGGSMEFINRTTSMEQPFFRYNAMTNSYHDDMAGDGVICLAVDILPTEFPKEASKHFGDILSKFVGNLARGKTLSELPPFLRRACISFEGKLTKLYEYVLRMRTPAISSRNTTNGSVQQKNYTKVVSLSGHLFDQFLINEALDIIEAANGSFRLIKCEVGQNTDHVSYSELEVGAEDCRTLDQILDSLASIAFRKCGILHKEKNTSPFTCRTSFEVTEENGEIMSCSPKVLILGAGHVCQPAVDLLASAGRMFSGNVFRSWEQFDGSEIDDVHVIVASLYLKDAVEITSGISNARAMQLDVTDEDSLSRLISDVDVVISLLPYSFHVPIARNCIELKKHLVTTSYVDDSMLELDGKARSVGVTILCEMGLDPGIDHMMAMKMIDLVHEKNGKVSKFSSYCGGIPAPEAADNPMAYKFSWNPAGAIKAGRNSATYKYCGETIQVNGNDLYASASRFRLPELPAFALECLPNRNSLAYGDLYGIKTEALTIFRGTLRYEGFSEIMGTLASMGLFDAEPHPMLREIPRPRFPALLNNLLKAYETLPLACNDDEIARRIISLGHCKKLETALTTVKTIKFLGLDEDKEIPISCQSTFDISCQLMQDKLTYSSCEKDMVILHHDLEVEFPEEKRVESHRATLLEFGRAQDGKMTSAMALTVGIPAAIGALLLLKNRIKTAGVIRPLSPEVYNPALEILEACGVRLVEKVEVLS